MCVSDECVCKHVPVTYDLGNTYYKGLKKMIEEFKVL